MLAPEDSLVPEQVQRSQQDRETRVPGVAGGTDGGEQSGCRSTTRRGTRLASVARRIAATVPLARRAALTYNFLYVDQAGGRRQRMKTLTYSESRAHYAETLDAVVDDHEEVVITRAGHEPVVIVALSEYESLKESAYLLRSPENARRLLASIDRLEHGGGTQRDLLE